MCLWLIQRTGVRIPEPMWDGLHKDLFLLMSMCGVTMSVCLCVSEHGGQKRAWIPGARVACGCVLLDMGAGDWAPILWKEQCPSLLSCLASPNCIYLNVFYKVPIIVAVVCTYVRVCLCVMMCTCRGRRSLGSQFSLFTVGPRDWTQVIRLGMMSAFTYWVPRQLLYLFF